LVEWLKSSRLPFPTHFLWYNVQDRLANGVQGVVVNFKTVASQETIEINRDVEKFPVTVINTYCKLRAVGDNSVLRPF